MSRVLLFVVGVLLLCVTALGVLWLTGQVFMVLGALLTGAAGVTLRLMWFLALAALVGGVSYFIANAWRPGKPVPTAVDPARSREPRWKRGRQSKTAAASSAVVISAEPQVEVVAPEAPITEAPAKSDPQQPTDLSLDKVAEERSEEATPAPPVS